MFNQVVGRKTVCVMERSGRARNVVYYDYDMMGVGVGCQINQCGKIMSLS